MAEGVEEQGTAARDADAARLTRLLARGDRTALGGFYEEWFDRAYAMARGLTRRDEAFCLDVVQDAMLRVMRSMKPMETAIQLDGWMRRVVHTTALDRLRAERRRVGREAGASARGSESAVTSEVDERIEWVTARLAEMDERDRELVESRFARARTLDQAGEAARMTGAAAHGRLRRLMAMLRRAGGSVAP